VEAKFRVRSEVLDLKVCARCAAEAADLGLSVTELAEELIHAPPESEPAAA
jgi:hypothetical protein